MHLYVAFYRTKKTTITAGTSLEARDKAAGIFKAKKPCDVTVILLEKPVSTASL